jgi:hypothetical protein
VLPRNILTLKDNFIAIVTASNTFLSHHQLHGCPYPIERTAEFYGLLLKYIAFLALSLQTNNQGNYQLIFWQLIF